MFEDIPLITLQLLYLLGDYCEETSSFIVFSIVIGFLTTFASIAKLIIDKYSIRGFEKIPTKFVSTLKNDKMI